MLNSTFARFFSTVEGRVEDVERILAMRNLPRARSRDVKALRARVGAATRGTRRDIVDIQQRIAGAGKDMSELKKGLAAVVATVEEERAARLALEARIAALESSSVAGK